MALQRIERKKGSFKSLLFEVDISELGKTIDDIADVYFVVKTKEADTDANALLLKDVSDGISTELETSTGIIKVEVPWTSAEYTGFVIGKSYPAGLFIKFVGDAVADEDVEQNFEVVITQDLLEA